MSGVECIDVECIDAINDSVNHHFSTMIDLAKIWFKNDPDDVRVLDLFFQTWFKQGNQKTLHNSIFTRMIISSKSALIDDEDNENEEEDKESKESSPIDNSRFKVVCDKTDNRVNDRVEKTQTTKKQEAIVVKEQSKKQSEVSSTSNTLIESSKKSEKGGKEEHKRSELNKKIEEKTKGSTTIKKKSAEVKDRGCNSLDSVENILEMIAPRKKKECSDMDVSKEVSKGSKSINVVKGKSSSKDSVTKKIKPKPVVNLDSDSDDEHSEKKRKSNFEDENKTENKKSRIITS
jgi:hypothetical protein